MKIPSLASLARGRVSPTSYRFRPPALSGADALAHVECRRGASLHPGVGRRCLLRCAALLLLAVAGLGVRPSARAEAFTIAVLPDVQHETSGPRFANRLQWLVEQREARNIRFVLQVGDLVNFHVDSQYDFMSEGLRILDKAGMPYATCLGNHDTAAVREDAGSAAPGNVNLNLRRTDKYNARFPLSRFRALGGTQAPGRIDNAWHRFEAGGLRWLVINLELWPRREIVDWAGAIAQLHPDHNVILLTHAYMLKDGSLQQNNGGYGDTSPQHLFDTVVKRHANVRFVFCGHTGAHAYRAATGEKGNTIHQFLQCYHDKQSNPTRLIEIDPEKGTLRSTVYCPLDGQTKADGSTFELAFADWVRPAGRGAAKR